MRPFYRNLLLAGVLLVGIVALFQLPATRDITVITMVVVSGIVGFFQIGSQLFKDFRAVARWIARQFRPKQPEKDQARPD